MITRLFVLVAIPCLSTPLYAQGISGSLFPGSSPDHTMRLLVSRGSGARAIDSVRIETDGRFVFSAAQYPIGFYKLALSDTDQVDVIMDPDEPEVRIEFSGVPLQRHILVQRSNENKRLWEYKLVSRETQAVQSSADQERTTLQPDDTKRLVELDSIVSHATRMKRDHLARLIDGAPRSYFAKVVKADKALEGLQGKGPMAVARVFDFGDPALMRSSTYDKAVMVFLQNLNAVSEEQFVVASDSLMELASHDPECRSYMLDHLLDLFSTYGPDLPLQHLIDQYVVADNALSTIDPGLRSKVNELLKMAVGAVAPDVQLPVPGGSLALSDVVSKEPRTVLFFYSSTCEHCHHEMPGLKEIFTGYRSKGLQVVGIALDADSSEFVKCISDNAIPWPCYSEFIGWGAKAVKAFQVRATPAFFLLDDRMRILAKPVDAADLRRWLDAHADR